MYRLPDHCQHTGRGNVLSKSIARVMCLSNFPVTVNTPFRYQWINEWMNEWMNESLNGSLSSNGAGIQQWALITSSYHCMCVVFIISKVCAIAGCDLTCQNGGTRNESTCTCDCADSYSGDTCESECRYCLGYKNLLQSFSVFLT